MRSLHVKLVSHGLRPDACEVGSTSGPPPKRFDSRVSCETSARPNESGLEPERGSAAVGRPPVPSYLKFPVKPGSGPVGPSTTSTLDRPRSGRRAWLSDRSHYLLVLRDVRDRAEGDYRG